MYYAAEAPDCKQNQVKTCLIHILCKSLSTQLENKNYEGTEEQE